MTKEQCKELILWKKQHPHLHNVGSPTDYQGIRKIHIQNWGIRDLITAIEYDMVGEVRKLSDELVFPEMVAINTWHIGGWQDPHTDLYSNQEIHLPKQQLQYPSREWTLILNLNDDFGGGRTFFPPQDLFPDGAVYTPQAGDGILFRGTEILHGVEKVRRNFRYTISMWFSRNLEKMMRQYPTDFDHNEDTMK